MVQRLGEWVLAIDGTSLPEKSLIGGKAWSIARMNALGLNVPPACVITTRACVDYLATGTLPTSLGSEIDDAIAWLEARSGRTFGRGPHPLLVSVRSGAPISMPGMMDTVLNLGIDDSTEPHLGAESGDPDFARDTHRRFLDLYARIVLKTDVELPHSAAPADWRARIAAAAGAAVPATIRDQLHGAVTAVFESWNSRRARRYREHHAIAHDLGTAVTIQAMVFGNMDDRSGTGVLFSRNPLTGENIPYGEFLPRAQGEDIVSGSHTPLALSALKDSMPALHDELIRAARALERSANDAQDIEFTIERDRLFLLQTRAAKRSPQAAIRMAVDMVDEGVITARTAISRITPEQIRTILCPRLVEGADSEAQILARGEAASPGVGSGLIVTDSDEAERRAQAGEQIVLARSSTSPEDLHGMIAARAIITERGGSTSHAAVVGRALGRPCVVGCGDGTLTALAGKRVTIDGSKGLVIAGELPVLIPDEKDDADLRRIASWAGELSSVMVKDAHEGAAVDFDAHSEDAQNLAQAIRPGDVVKGIIFSNDDALVRTAVERGAAAIVTHPVLPALLAGAQASQQAIKTE